MSPDGHIVVIGAGVAGLGSALALAAQGRDVTILERDATPLPADPDAAFTWDRRGAPQVRHSHAFLARLRNLLRDRHPDVLAALLEAGATEMRFCEMFPPEIDDASPRPGDEDLVALACRRTTFEWVLRRAVLAHDHVRLRDGVAVEALTVTPGEEGIPRVDGLHVRTPERSERLAADVVVAANGRRSGIPRWLGAHGIEPEVTEEDTGIVYFSRFYRLRGQVERPPQNGPIGGDLGYLKYAVFQGDNDTFSVTFAVRNDDDVLRAALLDPDNFEHAAGVLPATAPWAAPGLATPITPVHVMGGLVNRSTAFVRHGRPIVAGFHAVGDAHTCSNPLYGRGCSLAMVQAALLAESVAAHPDDLVARALAYEAASDREILPWYQASVTQDRLSREMARREQDGTATAGTEMSPEQFAFEVMREGLFPALRTSAVVFRAFIRAFNLLDAPDALLRDSEVMGRVLAMYQDRDARPPEPPLGPPRDEMLGLLAA